jgi:hypothetical protein
MPGRIAKHTANMAEFWPVLLSICFIKERKQLLTHFR